MQKWKISVLPLDLKFDWVISRNTSIQKENLLIEVSLDNHKGRGEVAFNVRYHESKEIILEQFDWLVGQIKIKGNLSLQDHDWLINNKNLSNSLKMGVSQALLSLEANQRGITIWEVLKIKPPENLTTSFSIPIIKPNEVHNFLKENKIKNNPVLKLKIKNESSVTLLNSLMNNYDGKVRIDANEGFQSCEEFLKFFSLIEHSNRIEMIEQPLPSSNIKEMKLLKDKISIPFIADESITEELDLNKIKDCFDGVNIKLMKSGTVQNAISQLKEARALGLKTMIGCMIESSWSISYAFMIAECVDFIDLDGFLLISKDPYNILEYDDGIISLKK